MSDDSELEDIPDRIYLHIIADSTGRTASSVVCGAVMQFPEGDVTVRGLTHVKSVDEVRAYIDRYIDEPRNTTVFHTILDTGLRRQVIELLNSRGIASVEYGDLTSGLFKINRKHGGRDLRMRFKSDMKSKLVYAGKGWEWGSKDLLTMNVSANFLDSRADPRNPRQNYKRLTGSWRVGKTWSEGRAFTQVLHASFDYTGSFDDQKSDTDLDNVDGKPIETYRSTYNKFALAADYALMNKSADVFFRSFKVNASFSLERDLIDRWKHVALGSEQPLFTSLDEGVHDAVVLPATYDATLQVDGRPFYA